MSDLEQCTSRDFISEIIELYKSLPCLWKIQSNEYYSDWDKKIQAYKILVEKYKEVDQNATRETVINKISSLRSAYLKELVKVNESQHPGAGTDEVCKPSLWCLQLFDFLRDQEIPQESINNLNKNFKEEEENGLEEDVNVSDFYNSSTETSPFSPSATPAANSSRTCSCASSSYATPNTTQSNKRKRCDEDDQITEVTNLVGRKLLSMKEDDSFDVFGKYVASKLRGVDGRQNIFAQKLINDVMFEAEMGTLSRNFRM